VGEDARGRARIKTRRHSAFTRDSTPTQARVILSRFLSADSFRVVSVTTDLDETVLRLREALSELGVSPQIG
jgi:hypothetical protein